ncbi:MAG: DUF4388 domain-containing protein [Gemmatimonadota bacterium]
MALEGSLEDVGLADILQLLALGQKTGCLSVTDRSNFGYVYFDKGKVIYASVLNRPDRLGELLVRNKVIDRDELSTAMKEQGRRPGTRLGQILVEMGSLSEEELHGWIQTQIEEAVYHLFAWEKGSFHFEPDQAPEEVGIFTTRINADSLLMEGARRVDELSLIEKKIPSRDLVFAVHRDPSEEEDVELSEAEAKVFPLVDGERTVREIVDEAGLVEFEGMKALFGLIQAGFVAQAGQRPSEDEGDSEGGMVEHLNLAEAFYRSGMMEDAAREYRAVLEFDEENPDARLRLGCVALRAGVPEEALGHFDAVADRARRNYVLLRNRGLALEELGRYEEAMESLMDAEASRPGDRGALLHRAIVLLKAGRAAQASEIFERYRRKIGDRTPPPIYYAYAVLAASLTGDLVRAAAIGREGLSHYDDHGAILVNTGVALQQKGEPDAAEAFFLRAVKSAPATPAQAHKNLGDAAFSRGDADGARAHYERAVKIDPRLGDQVYQRLGEIAYMEDEQDLALLLWQRALELNSENERVRAGLEALNVAPGG